MRDRLASQLGILVLAVAVLLGGIAIGAGLRHRGATSNDTISVTGSAKQRITSDYVIWNASVSSQAATPQAAVKTLTAWTERVRQFLLSQGVLESELALQAVSTVAVHSGGQYSDSGPISGYNLTRSFEVRSARVAAIASVVEQSSKLLEQGIPIQSNPPQYLFTKLASIRPVLLAKATKDALGRAKVLVDATGGKLGKLRDVNVGVFQVTSPNSTDVSDYGVYDTSTLEKDVTAVVNVTFGLT